MIRTGVRAAALVLLISLSTSLQAAEPAAPATREQYAERLSKTAGTASAQWKLALWCEAHGLKDEAKEHLATVVKLDPKRELAWKRLGCKKVDGVWMTPDEVKADAEAKKSIRAWGVKLAAIHKNIHKGKKKAEAEKALADVTDPLAVPAIAHEFSRGEPDHTLAVQTLGQIQAKSSSKALAFLAVYGASEKVRSRATESLRDRDPKDYAEPLIGLIVDPLRYEVKQVGGPDSPGTLLVEGEKVYVRRLYTAPAPDIQARPGDAMIVDPDGSPRLLRQVDGPVTLIPGVQVRAGRSFTMRDAQQAVETSILAAREQLRVDVEAMETMNTERKEFRLLVTNVLQGATGANPGEDRQAWADWLTARIGKTSTTRTKGTKPKPTIDQVMPAAYDPNSFGTLVVLGSYGVMPSNGKSGHAKAVS